jgi:hypothetical protein
VRPLLPPYSPLHVLILFCGIGTTPAASPKPSTPSKTPQAPNYPSTESPAYSQAATQPSSTRSETSTRASCVRIVRRLCMQRLRLGMRVLRMGRLGRLLGASVGPTLLVSLPLLFSRSSADAFLFSRHDPLRNLRRRRICLNLRLIIWCRRRLFRIFKRCHIVVRWCRIGRSRCRPCRSRWWWIGCRSLNVGIRDFNRSRSEPRSLLDLAFWTTTMNDVRRGRGLIQETPRQCIQYPFSPILLWTGCCDGLYRRA